MSQNKTITALSTPSAESAVALIRLSGPLCLELASNIFCKNKDSIKPRFAHRGSYTSVSKEILDDVIFTYFNSPHSYTGEDVLEIACHGSPYIVRCILDDLFKRNVEAAQPGEFTRRAFLNDKMDLSQAEAVSLLISSRSKKSMLAAQRQLSGELGKKINHYCDSLVDTLALIEAYIDFPDEELPQENSNVILADIERLNLEFGKLATTSKYSSVIHDGINISIAGAPNAGKSSLLNTLLGSQRAIVSDIAGTTRDFISEKILLGDHAANLIDTAGLRDASDKIESMGVSLALDKISSSDICLLTLDASLPAPQMPKDLQTFFTEKNTIVVLNKCDICIDKSLEGFFKNFTKVKVSCLYSTGLDDLKNALINLIETHHISASADDILVGARHAKNLNNARKFLLSAAEKIRMRSPSELIASDLREALNQIGEIVGKVDSETVLDKIFSRFCIGK